MKKRNKEILLAVCCGGVLVLGSARLAQAQSPVILAGEGQVWQEANGPGQGQKTEETGTHESGAEVSDPSGFQWNLTRIWGPVLGVEDGMVRIDNQSEYSSAGEIVLHMDPEYSRVLDAVNGYPVEQSDIQVGELIYAYIGPAMTMSLPPQTTAELVLCQIPADFKAPDYVQVKSMGQQEDGNWLLTTVEEKLYSVPADCQILPYLTRNRVVLEDITESSRCLIWSDEAGAAKKIVLFASE